MKKLLLILFAVFVSVMAWAATLNPYAYNLSSTWNEATSELTVRFKLNAHPNMRENSSSRGIQIFAIDPSDNNKQYYIYGVPGDIIKAKMNEYNGGKGDSYDYELTIPITGVTWDRKEVLPAGKTLTWAVNVAGLNKTDQASPVVVNDNIANRPYSCHGIAVNNNQNSADFGSIYVTEASNGVADKNTWKWLVDKGKSLLKYTPRLEYSTSYQKASPFSNRDKDACLLEPHRVRISDDGRIFVSSYNRNTRDDQVAVWELKNGVFTPVIYHNTYGGAQGVYGDRVCGMAVKGSGNNLRILLCFLDEYDGNYANAFRMYEYDLNNLGEKQNEGSWRCSYRPLGNTYDVSGNKVVSAQSALDAARRFKWYFYSDGFANVAYGKKNKNDVFLSIDYCQGLTYNASIVYFKEGATSSTSIQNVNKTNHYYGGGGFIPMLDGSDEYIISGRTKDGGSGTFPESNGYIHAYPMDGTTISTTPKSGYTLSNIKSETAINDMAMDCANNLYAVSFTDGSKGSGRLIAIAMPYGGSTLTIAPSSNAEANRLFTTLKPVPNILATDLRYDIVRGKNQYEFSFNVNTKPEEAQLRFYKSYEDMQKSFNVVNADYYDGTNNNKPLFVYNIPSDDLKQGRIAVQLGAVAGEVDANGVITNNRLPAGVLYWSVYVKTQKSTAFAPIYKQSNTREEDKHYRLHAAVNNYPETDFFGTVNVAQYDARANSPKKSLMIYGINPVGAVEESMYTSYNRYKKRDEYINSSDNAVAKFENQRHLTVAPNGMVFISDYGRTTGDETKEEVMTFANGGVKVWDPNDPTNDDKSIKLSHFESNDNQSATAVDICKKNDNLYLYRTNTYSEFATHTDLNQKPPRWEWYTKTNQENLFGWNGLKEYSLGTLTNFKTSGTSKTDYALKRGDASGTFEIVAMDQGVWMCQHREHTVEIKEAMKESYADNLEAYLLSFVPYNSNTRTWTSCTTMGKVWKTDGVEEYKPYSEWSQTKTSPLQSTPGSGLAYKAFKDASGKVQEEMLYVVNHDGNIVVLQITGWTNRGSKTATPTVKYVRTQRTPESTKGVLKAGSGSGAKEWKTAAITSMNFDYAGNLVTTTGVAYFDMNVMKNEIDSMPEGSQNVIIYTMPYNRVNAREIQAPNSCIEIPERVAQLDMNKANMDEVIKNNKIDYPDGCAIDLYRPLQGKMFNTICLPFTVNLEDLPSTHPLFGATLREYTGLKLNPVGGEEMLELVFTDVQIIEANKPYIIQLKDSNGYNSIIRFAGPLKLTKTEGEKITQTETGGTYSIFYQGIVPYQRVEPQIYQVTGESLTLMLVADNRLALMTKAGDMYGFRGYFTLNTPLPKGMQTRITNSKGTTTNTTIVVDGKKVNIDKYLREGRVYIRVGDSLYTVDGQLVK